MSMFYVIIIVTFCISSFFIILFQSYMVEILSMYLDECIVMKFTRIDHRSAARSAGGGRGVCGVGKDFAVYEEFHRKTG